MRYPATQTCVPTRRRPASLAAGAALVCVAAIISGWLGGCSTGGGGAETRSATRDVAPSEAADQLYQEMRLEYSLRNDDRTLELASALLNGYPDYPGNDAALQMAIGSAARLGESDRALRLVDLFGREFGDSPLNSEVMYEGAEIALAAGDTAAAAQRLVTLYDHPQGFALREQIFGELDGLLPLLDQAARESLFAANRQSDLWTYLGYHDVAANVATGDLAAAEAAVATMAAAGRRDRWLDAAEQIIATGTLPSGYAAVGVTEVDVERVGVLCPTTGRFALLGNAFYDGAQLAVDHVNREFGTRFHLQVEDTVADPVVAALAARQLCGSAGCIALVGALMRAPTVAAAVVADACGVPLVSPTATNDRIWELGVGVFQTNQTELFEARLMAQLTCAVLLKRRFAVIYPRTADGERKLATFTAAVEELDGEVVAAVPFAPETTDFSEPIEEIKKARPEVVYVPATVDQTILLGPQLDFYSAGSLIVGPSAWNAPKLVEQTGASMEGAVFPSDQAFFAPQWGEDFDRDWRASQYPDEATPLALRSYQATRFLLDTQVQYQATTRGELAAALQRRFSSREIETEGPESLGRTVRIIHAGRIEPFPAHLYAEAWRYGEAAADSLPRPTLDDAAGDDEF